MIKDMEIENNKKELKIERLENIIFDCRKDEKKLKQQLKDTDNKVWFDSPKFFLKVV